MTLGAKKDLDIIDMWELHDTQRARTRGELLSSTYKADVAAARAKGKQGSLFRAWKKLHGRDMAITGVMQFFLNFVQVAPFWVLGQLLTVISERRPLNEGVLWTAVLCGILATKTLLENHFFRITCVSHARQFMSGRLFLSHQLSRRLLLSRSRLACLPH